MVGVEPCFDFGFVVDYFASDFFYSPIIGWVLVAADNAPIFNGAHRQRLWLSIG